MKKITFFVLLLITVKFSSAQIGAVTDTAANSKKDSTLGFVHRNDAKDSITLSFRYLDSLRSNRIDSSINDFYKYTGIPAYEQYMGNDGNAAYSLIYSPI